MRLERGPGDASAPRQPPRMRRVGAGMRVGVILASSLKDISSQIASSIKDILVNVVDFLTPIVATVSIGMIIVGVLLVALRQEFYGLRLLIAGGIALVIIYLIIPLLMTFL